MVGSDIDGYTTRFHKLARLVPHMVTPENQRVNRYIRGLAPEIKANVTSSRPTTIQSAVSMANHLTIDGIKDGLLRRRKMLETKRGQGQCQYAGQHLKCAKCNFHHSGNCPMWKSPNPMLAIEGNPNRGNNRNQARGRAFALGVDEAHQDPNVMTGTFSLNDHFAIVLFDSGADYSFISTNFLLLIDMKTSVIILGYEIEIANGLKVETNKIV
ncbi:hypothetical protein Tco_0408830 [Tanacetum coccineum]